MAKTRQQKEEAVQSLVEKLTKSKSVIFTNFDGLNVQNTDSLRGLLRENDLDYSVTKRTLLKIALEKSSISDVDIESLSGGLGTAISYEDEVLPAKILYQFAKKNKAVKLIGGIYEGRFIGEKEVLELAKLPGKDELRAKFVWLINYPASGLVNVLAGTMKNFVYALNAIKESKN